MYKQFEDIAVVGMSGRFPDALSLSQFWENIKYNKQCISEVEKDQLRADPMVANLVDDPFYVFRKGVLKNADYFDAEFFGIAEHEANSLDPQIRIFLKSA
jgi:acyl transferase domain-containing protein